MTTGWVWLGDHCVVNHVITPGESHVGALFWAKKWKLAKTGVPPKNSGEIVYGSIYFSVAIAQAFSPPCRDPRHVCVLRVGWFPRNPR